MSLIKFLKTLLKEIADELADSVRAFLIGRNIPSVLADAIATLVEVLLTLWATSAKENEVNEKLFDPLKNLGDLLQGFGSGKAGEPTA